MLCRNLCKIPYRTPCGNLYSHVIHRAGSYIASSLDTYAGTYMGSLSEIPMSIYTDSHMASYIGSCERFYVGSHMGCFNRVSHNLFDWKELVFVIHSVESAISDCSIPLGNSKQVSTFTKKFLTFTDNKRESDEKMRAPGDSILDSLYTHCNELRIQFHTDAARHWNARMYIRIFFLTHAITARLPQTTVIRDNTIN